MIGEPLSAPLEPTVPTNQVVTQGNPSLGKEEFLTLLIAQLKNQDPLNPTNPEEMAAQLAQFSSLEQLITVNETLQGQTASNNAMAVALNSSSAVGILGKTVLAVGDQVDIDGTGDEILTVGVGGSGGAATLTLYDADGTEVGSYELGSVGGGRQEIAIGQIGQELEPGRYRYELNVSGPEGQAVEVQSFTRTLIDGVRYGPAGPLLVAGTLEIPLANVVEIFAE